MTWTISRFWKNWLVSHEYPARQWSPDEVVPENGEESPQTFIPFAENPGRIYLPNVVRGVGVPALIHDTIEKFYHWDENVSVVDGPRDSDVSCRNLNAPE